MRKLLVFFMVILTMPVLAQREDDEIVEENDIRLWTGGTVKFEFTKDLRLEVEQQYRISDTISNYESSFTEFGVRYEFNDWLDAKGQYRYTSEIMDRNTQRWSLDISAKYEIDDFPVDLEYRFRVTDSRVDFTGEKDTYVRNRFGLDWNMSKLVDPFFEYENFYKFNEHMEFRVNRFTLGLEWKLSDESDFETYYRVEDEFNTSVPEMQHIIGIMIDYEVEFH